MPAWAITLGISGGAMALQYLFRPKIKQEPVDKGKFDDIRITFSDLGAFYSRGWGKWRQGGQILVSTGIDHYIIETPTGGGKGGVPQAPATRTHVYKTSVFVGFTRRITNFHRIWADADIYVGGPGGNPNVQEFIEAEDATLSGGATVAVDPDASEGEYATGLGSGGEAFFDVNGSGISIPGEPGEPGEPIPVSRLSFFYKCTENRQAVIVTDGPGGVATNTITFFASPVWTVQTFHIAEHIDELTFKNAAGAAPDLDKLGVYYYYLNARQPGSSYRVSGAVNSDIGYPVDLDDPSEYYNLPPTKDGATGETSVITPIPGEEIRFYTGTETQTQDSRIISWLDDRWGAGQGILRTSAMRGITGIMFQDFTLKQGRVPNFTAELEYELNTVNDILEELFSDVNVDDYDFTATEDLEQVGFLEHTSQSRRSLIEHLGRYHQFRLGEIDGEVKTILDNSDSIATIDADDLRAHSEGEEAPRFDAEVIIKEESLLPREVRVSIMNPALEYHNESLTAQLFTNIKSTESKEYTFPIVDPPDTARQKADVLLRKEHAESLAFEFWGMPGIAKYAIGDTLTLPLNGIDYLVRIEKIQRVLPVGKIKFQAVLTDPSAYFHADETLPVPNTAPNVVSELQAQQPFPRNSVVFVIQSVPIVEKDEGRLGVYLAISGRGRGYHENAALYREIGDENFVLQQVIDSSSPLGLCEDTLGTHGDITTEDTTNVLDIWFFDEIELETVTGAEITRYPQVNLMRVGEEWLQFRTATPQTLEDHSPYRSKWRISNLMRGRFHTESAKGSHDADEYAALVTPALRFYELEETDIGETVRLKAVTGGQAEDVAPASAFVFDPPFDASELKSLFDHYTDATTGGTTRETLYSNELVAGTLLNDGDAIFFRYAGRYAANINAGKYVFLNLSNNSVDTDISESDEQSGDDTRWEVEGFFMRVSNSVLRYESEFTPSGVPAVVREDEITGLDLDNELIVLTLDARTQAAAADLTARIGKAWFLPAAPVVDVLDELTFLADPVTFLSSDVTFTP